MTELPARTAAAWPQAGLGAGAFFKAYRQELANDRLLYGLIGVYAVAAFGLAAWLGVAGDIRPFTYMFTWCKALFLCVSLYLLVVEAPPSMRADPKAPLARLRARLPVLVTPRVVSGLTLVLSLGLFMGIFTTVKTTLPHLTDFTWDPAFAELDRVIHGTDPWRILHPALGHAWLTRALEWCYATLWMTLVVAGPAWAAMAPVMAKQRHRFLITYFLCWIVLGNVMAGIFYSGGPCFYAQITGDAARYAELIAYHKANFDPTDPGGAWLLQQWLWKVHSMGGMEFGNGISAFPSLHVAMATMAVIAGFCVNRKLGAVAVVYLAVILASSVHLAWHYAIDGYVSIVVVLLMWFLLKPLERKAA